MQFDESLVGSVLVLGVVESRLDSKNGAELKQAMTDVVSRGHRRVLMDLTQVGFIDSTGLGALVTCLKLLGKHGELALCGLSDPVLSLIRLTRMDRVFHTYPSRAEGLAALSTSVRAG